MVDYSRWDNIEVSSDEEVAQPSVTVFDNPKRVTIDHKNITVFDDVKNSTEIPHDTFHEKSETQTSSISNLYYSVLDVKKVSRNGGIGTNYIWSQCRNTVSLYLPISECIKGPDLEILLPSASKPDSKFRDCASTLTVIHKKLKKRVIDRQLCHTVLCDEETWFWEIRTYTAINNNDASLDFLQSKSTGFRIFFITLTKSTPVLHCVLWWKSFFLNDPEIDVTKIEDRHDEKNRTEFLKAWNNAQNTFSGCEQNN